MKQFPSTELRTKTTNIYNEVLQEGIARICHRDRPNMYLMSEKHLEGLVGIGKKLKEGQKAHV